MLLNLKFRYATFKCGLSAQILEYNRERRKKKQCVQMQNIPRMQLIVRTVKEQHYMTVNKCEEQGEGRYTHIVKLKCTDTK